MTTIPGSLIAADSIPGDRLKPNAELLRQQMKQVAAQRVNISPLHWRVWDSGALLPSAAANDDLGLTIGTWGTGNVVVDAGDLKAAGATTRYALARVSLPDYFDDGKTVQVRLRAGMKTTIADTSCTIDVEAYKVEDDGAAGADLCTTAAQDMNAVNEADLDFTLTGTGLVGGDEIELRIAIVCNDAATGTAVTPTLYRAALLFDARG